MIATNDLAKETVAVVLAGGKGTRLGPLTHHVCKPAVTFGATYRNIDFSLSNCVNSGIFRIGVATQHKPERLLRHLDEAWGDVVVGPEHFIAPWPAEARAPKLGYRGTVRRSVLFSGVAVSEGADVADTVVLPVPSSAGTAACAGQSSTAVAEFPTAWSLIGPGAAPFPRAEGILSS
jgi:ADP-glucose pyrophosphorylase